ncbi:MAG: lysophospholipid acyltransferase family protein [Arenimonas sp.]
MHDSMYLPPNAPHTKSKKWVQKLGRWVLKLGGWKIAGEWPNLSKMVMIAAPHSSGWDAVWGMAVKAAIGVDIVFIGKAELFKGPLGWVLRKFGGRPVDRSAPGDIIDQIAAQIRDSEKMWFVLAPEGTRKRVTNWKPGFWKIARKAGVPVCCAYFHYPDKAIGVGPVVELTDDFESDMKRFREIYRPYKGKNRGIE